MVKPDEIKAYTAYQSACAGIDKADLYSVNIIAVENRDEEIGESVRVFYSSGRQSLECIAVSRISAKANMTRS